MELELWIRLYFIKILLVPEKKKKTKTQDHDQYWPWASSKQLSSLKPDKEKANQLESGVFH